VHDRRAFVIGRDCRIADCNIFIDGFLSAGELIHSFPFPVDAVYRPLWEKRS
jgi:hypothetical protein